MPVNLQSPMQTATLDKAKIVAVKIEHNPAIGQKWIELWIVVGHYGTAKDPDTFIPYVDPRTGRSDTHLKIENGQHPLAPSMALGRCSASGCRAWVKGRTDGTCDDCGGDVKPYKAFNKIYKRDVDADADAGKAFMRACYRYLLGTKLPDPEDFTTMVPLLAGTEEFE